MQARGTGAANTSRESSFVQGWQPGSSQVLNGHMQNSRIQVKLPGCLRLSYPLPNLQSSSSRPTSASPSVKPDLTVVRIAWPVFEARTPYLSASGPYCLVLRQSAYPAANRRVAHISITRRRKLNPSDISLRLLPTRHSRDQSIPPLLLRRTGQRY